jgi:hypothetical protein
MMGSVALVRPEAGRRAAARPIPFAEHGPWFQGKHVPWELINQSPCLHFKKFLDLFLKHKIFAKFLCFARYEGSEEKYINWLSIKLKEA